MQFHHTKVQIPTPRAKHPAADVRGRSNAKISKVCVTLGFLALTLLSPLTPASAQQPAPQPQAITLAQDRVELDGLGLSFIPPADSRIESRNFGDSAAASVILPDDLGTIAIQSAAQPRPGVTITDLETAFVATRLRLPAPPDPEQLEGDLRTQTGSLLPRSRPIAAADENLRPLYLTLNDDTQRVNALGFAAFPVERGKFTIFTLFTTQENLARARTAFEIVIGTISRVDSGNRDDARAAAAERGARMLDEIGEDGLSRFFTGRNQYFQRYYRPATGGADSDAEELGYRRVTLRTGPRGLISGTPEDSWSPADRAEGHILEIDSRLLTPTGIADSRATFFVSTDRSQENWTIRLSLRDLTGGPPQLWTETGARVRDQLIINIRRGNAAGNTIRPTAPDRNYLSRVEAFLLPQILAAFAESQPNNALPYEVGFYTYDQSTESVRFREDSIDATNAGAWQVITRRPDADPQTTTLNDEASVTRIQGLDGSRWEPITLDRIYQIWESKGLPLD